MLVAAVANCSEKPISGSIIGMGWWGNLWVVGVSGWECRGNSRKWGVTGRNLARKDAKTQRTQGIWSGRETSSGGGVEGQGRLKSAPPLSRAR
jgi:hypothetical protein